MTIDDPHDNAPPTWRQRLKANRKRIAWIAGGTSLAVLVSAVALATWLVQTTPNALDVSEARVAQPSQMLFADGQLLDRFGDELYEPVTLAKVPKHVVAALLATEDARFREHHGVDPVRLLGAVMNTARGNMQGASTITQQLARNLFPEEIGRQRSVLRKVREMTLALKIERHYSKDQILEMYLNSVPFLFNVVGIEMASRTYFGTTTSELDTVQAATLIGMLKGSHQYNPVRNPERARERRNLVLAQMVRRGALSAAALPDLQAQPLGLKFTRLDRASAAAPHFVVQVRRQANEWAEANDYDLSRDGLVVETTLDPKLQALAEHAVDEQAGMLQQVADNEWSERSVRSGAQNRRANGPEPFTYFWQQNAALLESTARDSDAFKQARQSGQGDEAALARVMSDKDLMAKLRRDKTRLEASFIAIDPRDGSVKAWVGSRDFATDSFDHVSQAKRQPGSTFKPFVYGAALLHGISSEHQYLDEPIEMQMADGQTWRPTDMGGSSGLPMTLRQGLAQSKNTITTQVMQDVGLPAIVDFARAAGIRQAKLDPVPSLALGTSPVSLLEMAGAYSTLAAMGMRHEPILIRRISDRHGRVLVEFAPEPERVIDEQQTAKLVDIMRDVITSGTATMLRSRFGIRGDVAGKTGTTQRNTDGWFFAMQPTLVTGAWVGFNDQHVTMRSSYWGQGGHNALQIVGDFMRQGAKGGLIDTKARFPDVQRDPPELMDAPAADPDAPRLDGAEPIESEPAPPDAPSVRGAASTGAERVNANAGVDLVVRHFDGTGSRRVEDAAGAQMAPRSDTDRRPETASPVR